MTARPPERSANETAFRFTRAGMGAGLPPGLAEDLGRVAKHLHTEGHDPDRVLAAALRVYAEDRSTGRLRLEAGDGESALHADEGDREVSVLFAGPVLADWLRGGFPEGPVRLRLMGLDVPALAPVYALALAPDRREWGWRRDDGKENHLIVERRPGGDRPSLPSPLPGDDPVRAAALVDRFFQRSLVPASAQSRAEGAGAGLVDRD